jgi:predicted phage tail protein
MGRRFGQSFRFDIDSLAQAARALGCQIPGFRMYVEGRDFIVTYGKKLRSWRLGEEHVDFKLGKGDIHIVPVVGGAKNSGIGKIIAGVVIAAVAWWAAPFTILGMSAGNIALLGVGMALTGVSQMLTPKEKKQQNKKEGKSFMFDSVENTADQGGPVPLVFGTAMIGSTIISAAVMSVDSDGVN